MKSALKILACLVVLSSPVATSAAGGGCRFQGAFTENSIRTVVNYCAANQGMSAGEFAAHCEDLRSSQFDGIRLEPGKGKGMTSVAACPPGPKAVCSGVFGVKMSLQYMADDSSLKEGSAKLLCDTSEGRWRQ